MHRPHVHDGQFSSFRGRRFGAPADDLPPTAFVVFDQDHDQVGNRAMGDRLDPELLPLAQFCTLLSPFTPMLFMGEEYAERAPFQFFTDHIDADIAEATREGRRREFASFAGFSGEEVPDPQSPETFQRSKLTRRRDPAHEALVRRLLEVRRELPPGDVTGVATGDGPWLRAARGPFTLAANFSGAPLEVPVEGSTLVLATHDGTALRDGTVLLPPRSGALVR
jgi:maltooligosyltrehalose trehalohydrolase